MKNVSLFRTEICRKKEWSICNNGFYLPNIDNGDKTKCEKCDIEVCLECSGTINYKKCNLYKEGYILNNSVCIKVDIC